MSLFNFGKLILGDTPKISTSPPEITLQKPDHIPAPLPATGSDLQAVEAEQKSLPSSLPPTTAPTPKGLERIYAGILSAASFLATPAWFGLTIIPGLLIGAGIGLFNKEETLKEGLQRGIGFSAIPLFWTVANFQVAAGNQRRDISDIAPTIEMDPLSSYEEKKPALVRQLTLEANELRAKADRSIREQLGYQKMTPDQYKAHLSKLNTLHEEADQKYERAIRLSSSDKERHNLYKQRARNLVSWHAIPDSDIASRTIDEVSKHITHYQLDYDFQGNFENANHLRNLRISYIAFQDLNGKTMSNAKEPLIKAKEHFLKELAAEQAKGHDTHQLQEKICEISILQYLSNQEDLNAVNKDIESSLDEIAKSPTWRVNYPRLSVLEQNFLRKKQDEYDHLYRECSQAEKSSKESCLGPNTLNKLKQIIDDCDAILQSKVDRLPMENAQICILKAKCHYLLHYCALKRGKNSTEKTEEITRSEQEVTKALIQLLPKERQSIQPMWEAAKKTHKLDSNKLKPQIMPSDSNSDFEK